MGLKVVVIFLFIISLVAIVALYAFKIAYQFLYLRMKDGKKAGETSDFFYRNFIDKNDAERWKNAWMLFPLMFPIVLDEEKEVLNDAKKSIKQINLIIYVVLIIALLVVFYAAKAFPEGIL